MYIVIKTNLPIPRLSTYCLKSGSLSIASLVRSVSIKDGQIQFKRTPELMAT